MIFETPRLIVRNLSMSDLEAFHDLQGNSSVMRYLTGRPYTREENLADLRKVLQYYQTPENTFWVWAVDRKEDDVMIGTCALIVNDHGEQELGYRLREEFWCRGYGRETLEGLIDYAVQELKINRLVAYVNRENIPSVKLLERSVLNFEREFYNDEEGCWDRYYVYCQRNND